MPGLFLYTPGLLILALVAGCVPMKHGANADARLPVTATVMARARTQDRVLAAPRGPKTAVALRLANFSGKTPSKEVKFVADWVADSRDNQGLSFVILDKKNATLFVFDATARVLGSTPVLLGAAVGDDSVPGIGDRPVSQVRLAERTTPSGRFRAEAGNNLSGEDVVWVDYDAAVSMHRVRVVDPKERRLERLASLTTKDNRISYGCVNVPVAFYETILKPMFASSVGIVYVLPEQRPLRSVFPSAYDPGKKSPGVATTRRSPPAGAALHLQNVRHALPGASGKV